MAAFRALLLLLLAFLLVTTMVSSTDDGFQTPGAPPPVSSSTRPKYSDTECTSSCEYRCSMNRRRRVCVRACSSCCRKCQCVPRGPRADRRECGDCYVNTTTHYGRPKCP